MPGYFGGFAEGCLLWRSGEALYLPCDRWLCMVASLAIFMRDYTRVEQSCRTLRFEWTNVKTAPAQEPDVLLLNQWRDPFKAARLALKAGTDKTAVEFLRDLAGAYPNPGLLLTLAQSRALNDAPD